jgi:uncharacterized membrane protein
VSSSGACSYPNAADNTPCNGNLGACQSGSCNTPHFTRYGTSVSPVGISADGSIVAMNGTTSPGLWTRYSGFQPFVYPTATSGCGAFGISADGLFTAGACNNSQGFQEAVRWTGLTMSVILPLTGLTANYNAISTSAHGEVTCGNMITSAGVYSIGYWRSGAGPAILPSLANAIDTFCTGINGDGTVVVGLAEVDAGGGVFPNVSVIWTSAGMALINLPANAMQSQVGGGATGITADGTKVVGNYNSTTGENRAYVYSTATGMSISVTAPGDTYSYGDAISDDGTTVAGHGNFGAWLSTNGAAPVLVGTTLAGFGVDLTGFSLDSIVDVSADGKVVVGIGSTPGTFGQEGWIAVLK